MAVGNDIQKWADTAMYHAEAMPTNVNETGPQVHLLEMSADPLGQIAAACLMYEGVVVRDLLEVTVAQRKHYLAEIVKTKLKAPFEFVKFHFLIEGVTRSFTHQQVRQRTAVFAQESLRFAVKDGIDEEVVLPPSLAALPADDPRVTLWKTAVNKVDDVYHALVDSGIPAEDARGLLPHNIATRDHYSTDLRALQDHMGNRLCTQAQFEWRAVCTRMVEAIRQYNPYAHAIVAARNLGDRPSELMLKHLYEIERWQYEALADVFRPVCYLTGKCEFKAAFDRSCSIRERVEANSRIGRPSNEWDTAWGSGGPGDILPIKPYEWLGDSGAAR